MEETLKKIKTFGEDSEGLLGYAISISEEDSPYDVTGHYVLTLFRNHPENAEVYNDMLIAICGLSLQTLADSMADLREDYLSL